MRLWISIIFLLQCVNLSLSNHYKGGTISWRPLYPYSFTNLVQIVITERHSWTFTRYPCNQSTINSLGVYNDTQNATSATLTCISSSANCTSSLYQPISSPLYCTDFYTPLGISSGTYVTQQNLTANSTIDIAWQGASWGIETLASGWSLTSHIDLTPINGKINSSPVTATLPILKFYIGQVTVIQVLAADWDNDQIVRCRWSNQLPLDECGNACFDLPNGVLNTIDCAITWTAVLRAADVANGLTTSTYIVAITAEDFINASSSTPLSATPHQMLVYVYPRPVGACSNIPALSSTTRRNRACLALGVNYNYNLAFVGRVYCLNDSIVDFITSSPLYMQKTNIVQISNYTWLIYFGWTPRANQTGLQPFCVAAVDNNGQSSLQWCMTFVVGGSNPGYSTLSFVQGSLSPVGTVMSTQSRFSMQATLPVKRTTRNQTFISIYQYNNSALVYRIDCKYSPDVFFLNRTIVFYVRYPSWLLGMTYFITLTEGVATADEYCGTESGGLGGSGYWRFTIWDSSLSSTTTASTTTSTATTHTVTTLAVSTTTYNTLYTTTGLPIFITVTTTSTTSTTSTSDTTVTTTSATTTTTTATTTTASIPDANVMYPKDMETQCVQPVAIAAALMTIAMIPLHLYGMINLFVKMNSHFQNESLKTLNARRLRLQSALNREEIQAFV